MSAKAIKNALEAIQTFSIDGVDVEFRNGEYRTMEGEKTQTGSFDVSIDNDGHYILKTQPSLGNFVVGISINPVEP